MATDQRQMAGQARPSSAPGETNKEHEPLARKLTRCTANAISLIPFVFLLSFALATGTKASSPFARPTPTAPHRQFLPRLLRQHAAPKVTETRTPTATEAWTVTPSLSSTATWTPTSSATSTATPTDTLTETATASASPTVTLTETPSATPTGTATPTPSETASSTATLTETPSATPSGTATWTPTPTCSNTPSPSATTTPSPTITPTGTDTATATPTYTPTVTATPTRTRTPTRTSTATPSPTATWTPTPRWSDLICITLKQGKDGYQGAEDTELYLYEPSRNYASQNYFRVGWKQRYAALLRFDLGTIPPGARVEQAHLRLFAVGWSSEDMSIAAYAVLRQNKISQASWLYAEEGATWGQGGCNDTATDRRGVPEDVITTNGMNLWYTLDISRLAQEWVSGSLSNRGVLLRGLSETSAATFHFASAERLDANLRPELSICYRVQLTPLPTETPTPSPSMTRTSTPTVTSTAMYTATPTVTATPTNTATATQTATHTPTVPTPTATRTLTPTVTNTPTPTATFEPTREIVFQNGVSPTGSYIGIEDTWLNAWNTGTPQGADRELRVGRWGAGGIRRTLLRIEGLLSYLPATAEIVSAKLYLVSKSESGQIDRVDALRVMKDWSAAWATWREAAPGRAWTLEGCSSWQDRDVDAEAEGAQEAAALWSWDITKAVQEWVLNPNANRGLLLMNNLVQDAEVVFYSSEEPTVGYRPSLRVVYREHGGRLPPRPTPLISFATYGDSRVPANSAAPIQIAMANEIIRRQPDFVLHLGDMVNYGRAYAEWTRLRDELFAGYLAMPRPTGLTDCRALASYDDPSLPAGACDKGLFAVPGRHEYFSETSAVPQEANIGPYLEFFSYLPNNGRNYAFSIVGERFADAPFEGIRVVALDSVPSEMSFATQTRLLEQDLEANRGKLIFLFVHEPLYSLGKAWGSSVLRTWYLPVLHRYPLALMTFSGDDHSYQRLQPPDDRITYIIAAGGGAVLYDQQITRSWPKAVHIKAFSYALVQVYPDRIELHAYKVDHSGEIWRMDKDVIAIQN